MNRVQVRPRASPPGKLRARPLKPNDPAGALAYFYLLERNKELSSEEPRARAGRGPEGVHGMRVATRRIRAALRAFRRVLPAAPRATLNRDFKWVARVLGDVRDLDVYRDDFEHDVGALPDEEARCLGDYRKHLANDWQQARDALLTCLASRRYRELRVRFAEFLRHAPARKATSESPSIRDVARRTIKKQYKRALRDGRAISADSPDDAIHELRIDCKRLRYSFEILQTVYGKRLNPFIKRLKALQGELGKFQDARVAAERLQRYAASVPMRTATRCELLALGQLICAQRRLVRGA